MRSILSLPPALRAVWTAVYAAVESLEHTGYDTAEERAWEAVRRANGGEMPEEPRKTDDKTWKRSAMREALLWFADEGHYEGTYRCGAGFVDACGITKAREALGLPVDRHDGGLMPLAEALTHGAAIGSDVEEPTDEERRLVVLEEAIEQPCPVTGEPFFMVLEHPDLGWVPTYGGPHDSWTAPERDGVDPDEGRAPMLFRWHYDHDEGAWGEYEVMGMRAVVTTRAADEPTDEEMIEALAPIVAAAHSGNAWASWPEQDRPYKIARFELLLQNDKVSADLLERQLVDAALASWKAARAWGRK